MADINNINDLLISGIKAEGLKQKAISSNDTQVKSNGNDVNLEMEVGQMVKNSLRHSAYVKILSKKYQQIQAAIKVQ